MQKFNTKRMVTISLLIALEIILSRFLSITTPIAKIGFAFLPIALIAIWYGPIYGGIAAAIADLIGAILFPSGTFFPGFTLTAFLTGMTYGLFLHKRPNSIFRIVSAVIIIILFLHLGLNTIWIWMLTGKGFIAILPTRIIQSAVMLPIQVGTIYIAERNTFIKKLYGIKI